MTIHFDYLFTMKKPKQPRQLDLFSEDTEKKLKIQAAIERLNKQFGKETVIQGARIPENPTKRFKKNRVALREKSP